MQITTLLVPHDGSWMADRALACAAMLRDATGARLDLLRIAPDVIPATGARSALPAGATDGRDGAAGVDAVADLGDPAPAILDAIGHRWPDLVVMASDNWSSEGLGIDVARQVARRSPVPVLVIPTTVESLRSDHDLRRILVALDGSEQAEQALGPARMLADALDADLLLLRVVTPKVAVSGGRGRDDDLDLAAARRYVEDLAQAVRTAPGRVAALAVVGEPGTMIAAVGRTQRASLLAMTTRGKGTSAGADLGGVVSSSLEAARMPLLLVPTRASPGRRGRARSSILKA